MARSPLEVNTGLGILGNILKFCDTKTNRNIINGLQKDIPQVIDELRKYVIMFDDLAYADARGVQKLLKLVHMRDLAVSLKGSQQSILRNIALSMSQNSLSDLKQEIMQIGSAKESDVEVARERILTIVSELINNREMFINRPGEKLAY